MPYSEQGRPNYSRLISNDPRESSATTSVTSLPPDYILVDEADRRGEERSNTPPESRRYRRQWHDIAGWRVGAGSALLTAVVALVINAVAIGRGLDTSDSDTGLIKSLVHGDCSRIATINTLLHLVINILSTLLLAGSNYCMQCLSSPTRADIDAAHSRMISLDIGVSSLRNLRYISIGRWALWAILCLSSLPLHLLFNSIVFSEVAVHDYNVMVATKAFDFTNETAKYRPPKLSYMSYRTDWDQVVASQNLMRQGVVERLDKTACLRAHAVELQRDRRNLIIIATNSTLEPDAKGPVVDYASSKFNNPMREAIYDPYNWICSRQDYERVVQKPNASTTPDCYTWVDQLLAAPDRWAPMEREADYCLSEKTEGQCGLHMNVAIAWIVLGCNLIKVIVMTVVTFSDVVDEPFCTIGDAVASFLVNPDQTTKGMCLTTHKDIREGHGVSDSGWQPVELQDRQTPDNLRWYHASPANRWVWTTIFFSACIILVSALLGYAKSSMADKSFSGMVKLGLGSSTSQTLIRGWAVADLPYQTAAILSILVANTPQLALSLLYFALNGLMTCMATGSEWSRFSYDFATTSKEGPKTLRTSNPQGQQRSTYFLQLPYRFALPLMGLSSLLHWLISQSIFLTVISIYDPLGKVSGYFAVTTCGFSPFAMVLVLCAGVIMFCYVAVVARIMLDPSMGLVGNCSAAISAACHVGKKTWRERSEMIRGPLVWGDIGLYDYQSFQAGQTDHGKVVRHCGFESASGSTWRDNVSPPHEEAWYA